MNSSIATLLEQRILTLDGAMGTMIQRHHLGEDDFRGLRLKEVEGQLKGDNDVLNLTRPDIIYDIHRQYLEAGADLITTNTFNAQRISQADYHLEDMSAEMALEGARIARRAADAFSTPERPRFVCGSVGPTNKACSMSPDVSDPAARDITYDQLHAAYQEQIEALLRGGVDAVLIETIFDTLNAKAAIDASLQAMQAVGREVPLMLSVTLSDLAGRTLSGQTLDAFLASVSTYPIFSIGLNCSFGARQMKPFLKELAAKAPYYVSAYPNAGLPNSLGSTTRHAETMAPQMEEMMDEGLVNIVGGCCGTDPEPSSAGCPGGTGQAPRKPWPRPRHLLAERTRTAAGHLGDWASSTWASAATWPARASSCGSSRRRTTTRPSPLPASRWTTAHRSSTSTWTTDCSTLKARDDPLSSTSSPPNPTLPVCR